MTGIAITTTEESNRTIKSILKALFNRIDPGTEHHLSVDVNSLELHITEEHSDWSPGNPCPECGNDEFSCIFAEERIVRFEDNEMVHTEHGDTAWPEMDFVCVQCDTKLSSHPAVKLLRAKPH